MSWHKSRPAAGVHDRRAADDQRLAAAAAVLDEVAGNLADERALGLLGRNAARHEREVAADGRAFDGNTRDAGVAGDDLHAAADIESWECSEGLGTGGWELGARNVAGFTRSLLPAPRPFHNDPAIHFLVGNFDPVAVEPDFGPLVGGAVEPSGNAPSMSASTSRQSCLVVGTAPWSAIWARIASITASLGALTSTTA